MWKACPGTKICPQPQPSPYLRSPSPPRMFSKILPHLGRPVTFCPHTRPIPVALTGVPILNHFSGQRFTRLRFRVLPYAALPAALLLLLLLLLTLSSFIYSNNSIHYGVTQHNNGIALVTQILLKQLSAGYIFSQQIAYLMHRHLIHATLEVRQ